MNIDRKNEEIDDDKLDKSEETIGKKHPNIEPVVKRAVSGVIGSQFTYNSYTH
jgi:hypothetical protein